MRRIDQDIFTRIGIETPEQVILAAGMKMQSRLIQQQHASGKGPAAIVHEAQIKREEPLESLRLFFEGQHSDVSLDLLDLGEKSLAVGAKLNPVGILPPAARDDFAQRLPGILKIVLPLAQRARVTRGSLLNQLF